MSDPFLGEIMPFAGNFAPRGWAFCNGQLLPIAQNTALFALLGTMYGGDGRTTFGVPDLRGRALVSTGTGPGLRAWAQGEKLGVESVVLNETQIPSHTHATTVTPTLGAQTENADTHEPGPGAVLGVSTIQGNAGLKTYSTQQPDTTVEGAEASLSLVNTGGGQSHSNMMPFLTLNFVIALQGVFPSRN